MEPSANDDSQDDLLVAAAKSGDRAALDTLLRRHENRVLRVLRLLGVPERDREDVAQEVFVRVFRHLDGFRAGRSFAGWLYRIAVNASHDYRSRASRRSREEAAWDHDLQHPADQRPGPAELVQDQERRRRLEQALEGLTERERAVFVLCEMEGLESREAARALGVSTITIRRHKSRARGRLRQLLEDAEKKTPPR